MVSEYFVLSFSALSRRGEHDSVLSHVCGTVDAVDRGPNHGNE